MRAVYLERILPEWLEREPENPYLATLAPLRWAPSGVSRRSMKKPRLGSQSEGVTLSGLPAMASAMARNWR